MKGPEDETVFGNLSSCQIKEGGERCLTGAGNLGAIVRESLRFALQGSLWGRHRTTSCLLWELTPFPPVGCPLPQASIIRPRPPIEHNGSRMNGKM